MFVLGSTLKMVALLPVRTMAPVDAPNATLRALVLLLANVVHVISNPARSIAPEVNVTAPKAVGLAARTTLTPERVNDTARPAAVAATVHVPEPELALKNTLSADVGAEAPPAPPDVADQFAVLVLSQVPVPPTQYLSAMLTPP
jgi:hypothetical protein